MASDKRRILVVDDEANARTALAELLREEGYDVETAADAFKALGKLPNFAPHVMLTDLKMPGMDGIELMKKVRASDIECDVIVMTAFGSVDTAVDAMRLGAADYLTKPINFDELLIVTERALANRSLRQETSQLRARLTERRKGNMVGDSPPIQHIFKIIDQVAPSRASVLITGESGTGKALVAEAIHAQSPRADGPFVELHCAALAETLLESELFGHERGAFTGALSRRDGRFQQAHNGTLFLDEIGEISPAIQVKLLRFLQAREFERVGGSQTITVDVRIVAATNRDLAEAVRLGHFREDLYYRLNVVNVEMPALRERRSDIRLLADYFLHKYAKENEKTITDFTNEAAQALVNYSWPGNVRQLENAVERAIVMTTESFVDLQHLPGDIALLSNSEGMPPIPGSTLADIERYTILQTLEATGGSTSKAARMLGISVRKVQYKLHAYSDAPKSHTDAVEVGNNDDPDDIDPV